MGKRGGALIGLAAVAIVAAIAWWMLVGRGAPGDERGSAGTPAATGPASPIGASLPGGSPTAAPLPLLTDFPSTINSTRPDTAPAGSLAILTATLVHDADDSPLPDVEVLVYGTITDTQPLRHAQTSARTAGDGTVRIGFDHAVRVWLVRALPGDGHALVELNPEPELEIALGETRHIDLRAPRGAIVRGHVVDDAQRPVPLASVLAWSDNRHNIENDYDPNLQPDLRAECDTAGRFELGGLGPQLVLMPEAAGMAAVSGMSGPIAEGAVVEDVTLVVGPATELRGRVVDPAGQPLASTWVKAARTSYLVPQAGLDRAVALSVVQATDAEGRFTLAPLSRAELLVSVNQPEFQPWSRWVTLDGSELLIQLSAGCVLTGMVFGADGAPLDDAVVSLAGASAIEHGQTRGWTQTQSDDGHFAFGALLPTSSAMLGVSAPGHAVFVLEPVVIGEDSTTPLMLRLEPERVIGGRIVDEQDQPMKGVRVSIRGDRRISTRLMRDRPWEEFCPAASQTKSDADGRFRLERLYDGLFELTVEDRGTGLRSTQSVRSGIDDLLIRFDPALLRRAVLNGTVSDATTGAPIDDFSVYLFPIDSDRVQPGMRVPGGQFDDAGGVFSLAGVEPGRWRAGVRATGYARGNSEELVLQEGEQHTDIALFPERSLRLRIVDQDGEPVHGAYVQFEDAGGQRIELLAQPLGDGTIGMTDKAGEVTAHDLPADRITIVLKLSLAPGAAVGRREVRLPVDLRVQPEGVQEFTIERRRVRCLVLSLAETDAVVSATVYDTGDDSANAALQQLEQDAVHPSERPITVTVTDADGTPVDTARCEPSASAPGKWSVTSSVCTSDEPNSWLATALPAGPSRAVITAEGCEPVTLDLPGGDAHLKRYVILRPVAQH